LFIQSGPGANRSFIETARRAQIVAAAIETIAEVGYANASLSRIAERIGISGGLISYHFAGKDELINDIVNEGIELGMAYMRPRILSQPDGPSMLRAYIESNLAFMRDNPGHMIAIAEITRGRRSVDGERGFYSYDIDEAVRALEHLLRGFQDAGQLRADFDPHAVAIAIRAAIDAIPARLAVDPEFDIGGYAEEIAKVFGSATRVEN
jgi:TetR/AcrR family transcriptional regulator, fatty acid metabolism regulator protein